MSTKTENPDYPALLLKHGPRLADMHLARYRSRYHHNVTWGINQAARECTTLIGIWNEIIQSGFKLDALSEPARFEAIDAIVDDDEIDIEGATPPPTPSRR